MEKVMKIIDQFKDAEGIEILGDTLTYVHEYHQVRVTSDYVTIEICQDLPFDMNVKRTMQKLIKTVIEELFPKDWEIYVTSESIEIATERLSATIFTGAVTWYYNVKRLVLTGDLEVEVKS